MGVLAFSAPLLLHAEYYPRDAEEHRVPDGGAAQTLAESGAGLHLLAHEALYPVGIQPGQQGNERFAPAKSPGAILDGPGIGSGPSLRVVGRFEN